MLTAVWRWRTFGLLVLVWVVAAVAGADVPFSAGGVSLGSVVLVGPSTLPPDRMAAVLLVAAAASTWRPVRRKVGYLDTFVHEAGHTFVAAVCGAVPTRIEVRPDASGVAEYLFGPSFGRFRRTAVSVAGYGAGCVVALGGVQATRAGAAGLWLAVGGCVTSLLLVLLVRNRWGIAVVTIGVAGLAAVFAWAPRLVEYVAIGACGVLLVGGVRSAARQFRTRDLTGHDAWQVQRSVLLPARLVAFAQLLWCIGGAVAAVVLILRPEVRAG